MSRPSTVGPELLAALNEVAVVLVGASHPNDSLDVALWRVHARERLVDHLLIAIEEWPHEAL